MCKSKFVLWGMAGCLLLAGAGLTSCEEEIVPQEVLPGDKDEPEDPSKPDEPDEPDVPVDPEEPEEPRPDIFVEVPEGGFEVPCNELLQVVPVVAEGASFEVEWSLDGAILSKEASLLFYYPTETELVLRMRAVDKNGVQEPLEQEIPVRVVPTVKEFSPYIASVLDYRPAPGQFVNELPKYEKGDTREKMIRKVEERLAHNKRGLVTLGGFGGSVVFAFDHTVANVPGKADFKVKGNAFGAGQGGPGSSAEPGNVWVAYDFNGDGVPNEEEWYELAGSVYGSEECVTNYKITYQRPAADHKPVPGGDKEPWLVDKEYIAWKDNRGNTGFLPMLNFHQQSYFPEWIREKTLTFTGTRLPDVASYNEATGNWDFHALEWGYADNCPNNEAGSDLQIEWAVDKNGDRVYLPGINFVKVWSSVNQVAGMTGEVSTDLIGADDLHLLNR